MGVSRERTNAVARSDNAAGVQDCGRFFSRARFGNSAGHCTM
jgi:hypothetical protein